MASNYGWMLPTAPPFLKTLMVHNLQVLETVSGDGKIKVDSAMMVLFLKNQPTALQPLKRILLKAHYLRLFLMEPMILWLLKIVGLILMPGMK